MINHTPAEYAFIRACIFLLQTIPPLSVIYTAYDVLLVSKSWHLPTPLRIWLEMETIFCFAFQLPYFLYLQRDAVHPPMRSRAERKELFRRSMTGSSSSDLEYDICLWFKGANIKDIGRDGVKSWLAWAFFEGRIADDSESAQELEEYTVDFERLLGRKFPLGMGKATPSRLTLDPIKTCYRSLTWYCCVGFVDLLAYVRLVYNGYHFHRQPLGSFFSLFPFRPVALTAKRRSPAKHTTYWCRRHTSKTRLPVIFVHGIGIGLYPYVNFLRELYKHVDDGEDKEGQVGILAIELMPISFRITYPALGRHEICREIATILEHHGYTKCVVVSHSYGSIITSHMLHDAKVRERIDSVLFIDPVCFLLQHPDVAYNFTVRKPIHANEYQLWYFASLDPGVAHTLGRRFFWSENVLWLEDLMPLVQGGMRVSVSLSGRDLIVNTEAVANYLMRGIVASANVPPDGEEPGHSSKEADNADRKAWQDRPWTGDGLEVLWFDSTDHGQVFEQRQKRVKLLEVVKTYCGSRQG
ncbi:hypothetical protein M409DRAFT_63953 [Zasmidium cellare ATCC 36951]|uniref:AB hydrolase-1 domain-containing protein n=1 Tax=Zasmidium cellare ATCC 36951 TaxID=1080233 RepID=A0A6A6CW50_ZASCE|nr:uncharacterized protein M409DRAFT_63953 [Zasmidium cellare ATCC 36951]KAF2170933.1 hypothetical protein M409DRAFT_63953 [Zasmidium cellare ATCC 36951]